MRNKFDTQLEELNRNLISMGALCEYAIGNSIKALLEYDLPLARKTIELDREIDQKEREIESACLRLILQQQPVARDLRMISSALKMITDMEIIGDQAADIAEIVTFTNLAEEINRSHISEMAIATAKMVTDSIDAYVRKDPELAKAVIQYDDIVDGLFLSIKTEIINLIADCPRKGENATDILMIAKYLERIGDHATNIAEWVVFSITGEHI